MIPLLADILEAHGGLTRWKHFNKVEATIVSGGVLFVMKGQPQEPEPRRMTAWLHEQRASVRPFGAPDQRSAFTPGRIAIEKLDGAVVDERLNPRASFIGHERMTPWTLLDRAYFNGYAMWTYLTTPFNLVHEGVEVKEIDPWIEGNETWRVLRARFPSGLATHSEVEDFYFGSEDLLLRRHDYEVEIVGASPAAQLVYDYIEADGLRMPSRRRAHPRGEDGHPNKDIVGVAIDISDLRYSGA
jgi:hypothetical protein